jgi:peptidoglycan hydrolase-like protein with peptidoglycan-binding domain
MSDPDDILPPHLRDPGDTIGATVGLEPDDGLGANGGVDVGDDLADDDDDDLATGAGGGRSRRLAGLGRGGRLPGSPDRRSRTLPVLLALAVLLGAVAGFVARGFVSPAQEAANAAAPQASLITAQVRFGVLPVLVTMRANIVTGHSVPVGVPSDLGGAVAVVTSVGVKVGERVGQGTLLATVAERPMFLFQGKIPVFRVMAPGIHGPDVVQLQVGLADAGFGTGSDPSGVYGPGTAAAVAALYKAQGLVAVPAAGSGKQPATGAKRAPSAEIPMGEVLFVPRLPARIGSAAHLGEVVSSGKPVVTLTSGRTTLQGFAGPAQVSLLRSGMRATAISDFTGRSFPVRITAVHLPQQVTFVPVGRLPARLGGQNVEVSVTTSRVRSFIVPVAAVSTAGNGQTFVTVATGRGNQTRQVPVRLDLVSGGEQAVTPLRPGSLRAGQLVVLGIATSQSKSKSKLRVTHGFGPAPGVRFSVVPVGPGG